MASHRTARGVGLFVAVALANLAGCQLTESREPAALPLYEQSGAFTDEHGEPTSLERFHGAPFILTAGYTTCSTRCPLTVEKLRGVEETLRARGQAVPILFLTLDPRTDTSERLERWKGEHHLPADWHFLRGSDVATRKLARSLEVHAAYDDGHIDHDVRIAVFDAQGRLARTLSGWSFDADDVIGR